MRLETNEAWIISKVFGEIDIFIYSPSFDPEAFHINNYESFLFKEQLRNTKPNQSTNST